MKLNYFFPTVIGYYNDTQIANKIFPIANKIFHEIKDIEKSLTYQSSFNNSQVNKYLHNDEFIKNYFINLCHTFAKEIGYKIEGDIDWFPFVSNMGYKDSHSTHIHPHSILSGIVYLEVFPNSAPIIFEDPRVVRSFNGMRIIDKTKLPAMEEIILYPKNGDVLIWESWLPHRVPFNTSDTRKILAWSISTIQ